MEAVKPVNMIDGERDTCPALLALYYPFVQHSHFPEFQSGKYTYRFLGFCVVLTALSRLRGCALNSRFLGVRSGVQLDILLLHPCFNTFSRGFLAASQRNIQDGDFSLLALCSMAFLIVTNGIFSPLCRRFTLTVPVCPSPAHRCESNERNTAPYRFTEHSFWLCHFGICECPILCHSGIVWRFISSRTMPKRHNQ